MTEHDNNRVLYNLFLGFMEIHILHHGVHGELDGLAVIKELGRHGYPVSSGTMLSHAARNRARRVSELYGEHRRAQGATVVHRH